MKNITSPNNTYSLKFSPFLTTPKIEIEIKKM